MELLCPICAAPLTQHDRAFICPQKHSFDMARQGYVNLLTVQHKHSLNPGDTREQVAARRSFLDSGFYAPLAEEVCRIATAHGCSGPIVDIGCGEGYYSTRLAAALDAELVGLDISKEAVRCAAGRHKNDRWLCATAARLPIASASAGLVTSLFALTVPEEFHRVLRPEGAFLQVLAAPDHLLGLKSVIYPTVTPKEKDQQPDVPGFRLEESRALRFSFTAAGEQVHNLLCMTPHVYRISREGAQRLAQTPQLTDTASCILNLYRPV